MGVGNEIILVDDSSSLGLIFKAESDDAVNAKKRRTQSTLSVAELKKELLKAKLSVEGSKSVLRMRLESSKLDNVVITKNFAYSLELEQLRLYCFKHDLAYDGKKAALIALLLTVPVPAQQREAFQTCLLSDICLAL